MTSIPNELDSLVDAWIRFHAQGLSGQKDSGDDPDFDLAVMKVGQLIRGDAGLGLDFVTRVISRDVGDEVLASLAAGPIEDLLAYHGPTIIDRVERFARNEPRFREALFGIWRNTIDASTWERLEQLRRDH